MARKDPVWFWSVPRGVQVWGDVCRRQPAACLALDDDDGGWPAVCRGQLVHTDPVLWIRASAVLVQLQARLAAMSGPERDGRDNPPYHGQRTNRRIGGGVRKGST
jgi:hypothetical protein